MEKLNKKKIVNELIEWLKALLFALVAILIITQFVIIAQIDGLSMYPTLDDGEHVITARRFVDYDEGDIIAFNFVLDDGTEEFHVKRIIGMPGDTVTIDHRQVIVNGETVIEDGLVDYGNASYRLANDEYFVVGDNYEVSYDSRMHGPVKEEDILGEIVVELPF